VQAAEDNQIAQLGDIGTDVANNETSNENEDLKDKI